jgi:tripartite-type tricarboxylate transporter receptor subunit TctC
MAAATFICRRLLGAGIILALATCGVVAQDSVAQFYKGKTVTIIVASSPGILTETAARASTKHR